MRNYNTIYEVHNALTGVLTASHSTAATLQGQPIDTINFQDMMGVLCIASLKGSDAADTGADVVVKFQEAATAASTGSDFSDITTGALNGTASVYGSAKFDTVSVVAGSVVADDPFYQRKLYCLLNQSGQKRYIRVHASATGTASSSMQMSISVAVLLGRPRETAYIADPVSSTTLSADVQYGFAGGSTPAI